MPPPVAMCSARNYDARADNPLDEVLFGVDRFDDDLRVVEFRAVDFFDELFVVDLFEDDFFAGTLAPSFRA